MIREKSDIISNNIEMLIENDKFSAKSIIINEYPHRIYNVEKRTYTITRNGKCIRNTVNRIRIKRKKNSYNW